MKKMYSFLLSMSLMVLLSSMSWAQCNFQTQTFDVNPVLASTNTTGAWYPDRYAPNAFVADAGRLKISIRPTDGAQNRPPAFVGGFYNTQGRKFNQCGKCVTEFKGDLYIPADWATKKRRSDMWATAYNVSDAISAYPIIGFRNVDGMSPGIFYYDVINNVWVNTGVTVVYDSWYNLKFRLSGTDLIYSVNNIDIGTIPSGGSTYFGNIIMQAYNFNDNTLGASYDPTADNAYDAFWDNLVITVPGVTNTNTLEQFCTIQAAIDDADTQNGHTISVAAGTYNEDVLVNKSLTINGAGIDVSTVVGPIGGGAATFQVAASSVVINGFTVTRAGNNPTDWNAALNSVGIAIQSQGITAEIKNCKIIGNRNGIDVNNSNGNNIHNNIITDNRTGLIFRNQTDNTILVQNEITNNWTLGVLFLDASGGSNTPIQTAINSTFNNNNISGNWYGGVVDRQTGGSLPAPGANLKNFNCNWYGTTTPVVTTANSVEPGYAAQIPVAYGGTATNPGGAPDIAGPASANIMYIPLLTDGTDNDGATTGFQPVPGSCAGTTLSFTLTSPRDTIEVTNTSGPATFDVYLCEGESFTGSNVVTTGPGVRFTETITTASTMSAGNSGVTYNNVAVPAPRAAGDQPASFFNASYGPYGINTSVAPNSPVETLTQTFQPYTDGAGGGTVNGTYDGETYGPTITIVYHISRKPSLSTTVNGVELTNDDSQTTGDFEVCNSTSPNVTVTQFVEDNSLTGPALRVYQTVTTTNATFTFCNDCSATVAAFATPFSGTATLVDPTMAGEVILRWQAFIDANGNNIFDEGLECAADTIEYTITVNPSPILVVTNPASVCNPMTVDITAPAVTAGSVLPGGTTLSYFKDAAATMVLDGTTGPATAIILSGTYYIVASNPNTCSDTAAVVVVIKPLPTTTLTASKTDVCPNTEVTLTPTCSIPSTVQWSTSHPSSPAGPTVTPNAPDLAYTYKATCIADGCAGNTDSVVVRTHRILVSLMNVGTLAQPTALLGPVTVESENLAVTWAQNTFSVASSPRKWNLIATGCSSSESAVFEFIGGPFAGFKNVDNNAPYAAFANVGATYFAQDHPNYGNGTANFPDGIYTLKVDLRDADGVGGPFPKNRTAMGNLLATRTLSFKIQSSAPPRIGVSDALTSSDEENWASIFTNPVSNEVVLRLSGKVGENVQLNMVNLQGQSVHQSGVTLESVSQYATINVSNFASGFYILKAMKGDKIKTIKVLKAQ